MEARLRHSHSVSTQRLPSPETMLRAHGLRPKKAWGQNFLRDGAVLDRIAAALEASPDDLVVELGAGLGHLTSRLASTGAEVIAIERDRDLVAVLEDIFDGNSAVRVMAADAKKVDLPALGAAGRRVLLAGNLPYHLTSPILFNILDQREHLDRAVITVQKEVADRLVAVPGTKDYGVMSVHAQMWAEIRVAFDIAAGSFFPPPSVASSVIRLDPRGRPLADPGDSMVFRQVVRGAFSQRRKTIRNTLKSSGVAPVESLDSLLRRVELDPNARPETIPIAGFARISRAIVESQR